MLVNEVALGKVKVRVMDGIYFLCNLHFHILQGILPTSKLCSRRFGRYRFQTNAEIDFRFTDR